MPHHAHMNEYGHNKKPHKAFTPCKALCCVRIQFLLFDSSNMSCSAYHDICHILVELNCMLPSSFRVILSTTSSYYSSRLFFKNRGAFNMFITHNSGLYAKNKYYNFHHTIYVFSTQKYGG